jgi:hydroxymethylbilane synthase
MDLIFATRPSTLARWQTNWVIQALKSRHPHIQCTERVMVTQGDIILDKPLPEIGGKGVFTQELEVELTSRRVHAAVHSLKDLPVENPPGLVIGCLPERGEVRDALISPRGFTLVTLPEGAIVGTSSLRRAAQLLARRPDLQIRSLRGNVDTRLRKVQAGQYDAIVLAGAGLCRLGLDKHISEWLSVEQMLPAPGQGALAVQCRSTDKDTVEILSVLDDENTRNAVSAERAFLTGLGGGCALPVAAYAQVENGLINLTGLVIATDGSRAIRVHGTGNDPLAIGQQLALQALNQGAGALLHQMAAG